MGCSVGSGVGAGDGSGVGWGVGSGVGCSVGSGVGDGVGCSVGSGVGAGEEGVLVSVSFFNPNILAGSCTDLVVKPFSWMITVPSSFTILMSKLAI